MKKLMKAHCKKSFNCFKLNEYYTIIGIFSVFEKDDFISLECDNQLYRFRLNQSNQYVDSYIGMSEYYYYDFFSSIQQERKDKIEQLSNL